MNYNRYLDIHLCTYTDMPQVKKDHPAPYQYFRNSNGTEHFYQFSQDLLRQMRYREAKAEGFTFTNQNTPNCKLVSGELTTADDSFLTLTSLLDTTGGGRRVSYTMNEQLKRLRYISCMVSIEHLKTNTVYHQLQALMLWISDPATVNKLRINCHGDGNATVNRGPHGKGSGVMTMGAVGLSADELVDALVRHGLTRPSTHFAAVQELAVGARWKLDSEKPACEKCNKKFGVFTRQHHCRRCGGLFCDAHSSKKADLAVALTGEKRGGAVQQTATANNVKRARVCDACYDRVAAPAARALAEDPVLGEVFGESVAAAAGETGLTNYGLKTITLALCMGAKADDNFSVERDPLAGVGPQQASAFVRDSLASRVLAELRRHNLLGIKVAASNQVLQSSDDGILALCGVAFPTDAYTVFDQQTFRNKMVDKANNEFAKGKPTFSIPAYIWGSRTSLRSNYALLATPQAGMRNATTGFSSDITVSPCNRSIYFSRGNFGVKEDCRKYLNHWKFTSWQKDWVPLPAMPGGVAADYTWKITAPNRVTRIAFQPGVAGGTNSTISITGRETEYFKDYKSYEVS